MGSQRTQHKQQRSVQNHHRSRGKTNRAGATRPTTKAPRGTPGLPLPSSPNMAQVDGLTALDFASAARHLTLATQRRGLNCPLFRSPPDLPGVARSLRHNRDGSVTVSVVVRGRYRLAVLADMIDGVVVANALEFGDASRMRDELWSSISAEAEPVDEVEVESETNQKPGQSAGLSPMTVGPVAA